ncbi:LPXTG cell wall anchor domain-containing protein [Microbacterium sp. EST19A]|uniref:LPXTG cell wall anchor domain-containing protein n=1 Tax=Microbacterium sp. EST19A TaxID=2862681 RepID=UPI001CBD16AD|nr:LPXTG cell wall anchor domain-containing protein [Microbacterium sp. EST19A]
MGIRRKATAIVTAGMLIASSLAMGGAFALPAAADDGAAEQPIVETVDPAVSPPDTGGAPDAGAPDAGAPEKTDDESAAPEPGLDEAVASADELPAGDDAVDDAGDEAAEDDGGVGALAEQRGTLWASVDLHRVTLSDGALTGTTKGFVASLAGNVSATTSNVYSVSGGYNDPAASGIDATVVYKVRMAMPGAPDENTWIQTRMHVEGGSSYAQCDVYKGDPRAGGVIANPAPYTCFPHMTQNFPNVRYTFAIEMNRYVESSGTIHTVGPVSLADGQYYFEQPFRIAGAPSVGTAATTFFSTVMRESDKGISVEDDMAKTRFSYRIQDTQDVNGVPTVVDSKYFIAGIVSRNRSGSNETSCWVFDLEPTGSTAWRDLKPAKAAPFTCTATGERADSGNWVATIIVAKRDITVIPATERPRQTDLYRDVCSVRPDDCDLRLATVVSKEGDPRAMSGKWENRSSEKPITHGFKFESKQSTTTTFGTELTLGVEGGIGFKYKAEIKASFEYEIASETSVADEQDVEIEHGKRAFIVGAPTIVHTEGDIYVLRGDRLFLLQGVVADFPLAGDNTWNYWVETEAIPGWTGGGVGGVQNPPLTDLDPAAAAAAAEAAAAAARAAGRSGSLAQTGGTADVLTVTLAAGLTLAGGLLLVLRRRRHQRIE